MDIYRPIKLQQNGGKINMNVGSITVDASKQLPATTCGIYIVDTSVWPCLSQSLSAICQLDSLFKKQCTVTYRVTFTFFPAMC